MTLGKTEKSLYKDYLRTFATVAVVFLHCAGDTLYQFQNIMKSEWWAGNIYDSLVRWCVPVFVMLSGSLLLHNKKEESLKTFFSKRMNRIALPYLTWTIIYLLYTYRYAIRDGEPIFWSKIIETVFLDYPYYHLWFVSMILSLYFLTPIWRVFIAHAQREIIEYFLIFWFIVNTIGQVYPHFFIVRFVGWIAYSGLFIFGYYLDIYGLAYRKLYYYLGIFGFVVTLWGTYINSYAQGYFNDRFYNYLSPNVMFMSIAVFLAIKHTDWATFAARFPKFNHFNHWFAQISFGVYLAHILILDVLKNGYLGFTVYFDRFLNHYLSPYIGIPLLTFFVLGISIVLIGALSRLNALSKWFL